MAMLILVLCIFAYLALVNLCAYLTFAEDKRRAEDKRKRIKQGRRIRERDLLSLAKCGGWLGAKYAQKKLRYKTLKQPFARQLNAIALQQCAGAAANIIFVLLFL